MILESSSRSTASFDRRRRAVATARSPASHWSRTTTVTASCGPPTRRRRLDAVPSSSSQSATCASLLERLEYVGVLALELFQIGDRLLANEIAPRVHNSGHWTIDGAETSQFENHLRAVCGLTLGSAALRTPTTMVNLVGGVAAARGAGSDRGRARAPVREVAAARPQAGARHHHGRTGLAAARRAGRRPWRRMKVAKPTA